MLEIRRVGPDEWSIVRRIRLAALKDSPDWFCATYEEEVDRPGSWWREFVEAGAWFVAYLFERPAGIAATIRSDEPDGSERQLISMWVEPGARGKGVGKKLIDAATAWARADGAYALQLQVTQNNHAATRLYERCGFQATGRTEPLPRKPSLIEHEMRLLL